jgi:serine/threonine-protein kinase
MALLLATESDWPDISRLLDEALQLHPSHHDQWLEELSGTDARHREKLRALLAAKASPSYSGFLETLPPLGEILGNAAWKPGPGQRVGPYRLKKPLGRGGMASVWLAERTDGLVSHQVALKLPHAVWGDAFAGRLGRERQILAGLEHPHIARFYDTGLDEQGRPWIAMEYVEGQAIDAWCRDRDLGVRERLEVMLQVLGAVAHAHHRLVIHRDLKPANILVTADGQAKLLDFGIAKLIQGDETAGSALTELTGRALTIAYASPEQIRGEPLGTASDVYSLGVIAFELLAGRRPYDVKATYRDGEALARAIADVEPRRASDAACSPALRRTMRGDLDAVLARALEKDLARRYPAVEDFAQDMRRYLAGEPVSARPASRTYRAAKFVRRHRVGVAMTAALMLSVGIGAGLSLWQARAARQEAARAASELRRQQAARELFTQTLVRLAALAKDEPGSLQKPHAVSDTLRAKLEQMLARGNNTPEQTGAMLEAVTMELHYLDDFEESLAVGQRYLTHLQSSGGDPHQVTFAASVAAANLCILHRYEECEAQLRAGLARSAETDDAEMRIERLHMLGQLGHVLMLAGKREQVLPVLNTARQLARKTRLNEEMQALIDVMESRYWHDFDDARAIASARHAFAVDERLGADAEDRKYAAKWLGIALLADGDAVGAEKALRQALALTLVNFGRESLTAVEITGFIVDALIAQGRYREAHGLLDALAGPSGEVTDPRNGQVLLSRRLAAWLAEGDIVRALALAVSPQARSYATVPGNEPLLLARARALMLSGRGAEARALMEALSAGWPGAGKPTTAWMAICYTLAQARLAAGDASGAQAAATSLVGLFKSEHASEGSGWRQAQELLALAHARLNERDAAAQALQAAEAVTAGFRSPVDAADSALDRAEVMLALGRSADAQALVRTAWTQLQGQMPDSPRLTRARRLSAVEP